MEHCEQCGKRGEQDSIRRCSRCMTVRYCSRDCQKRHWPRHKVSCKPEEGSSASGLEKERKGRHGNLPSASAFPETSGGGATASGAAENIPRTCQKCKTEGYNFKKCTRCQKVTYCSRDCQRSDWKIHRVTCEATADVTTKVGEKSSAAAPRRNETPTSTAQTATAAAAATASSSAAAAAATSSRGRDTARWASLLGTLYDTGTDTDPWQRAKNKASAAFPGIKVISLFRDLHPSLLTDINVLVGPIRSTFPMVNPDGVTVYQSPFVLVVGVVDFVVLRMNFLGMPDSVRFFWVKDNQGNKMKLFIEPHATEHPEHIQFGGFLCTKFAKVVRLNFGFVNDDALLIDEPGSTKVLGF